MNPSGRASWPYLCLRSPLVNGRQPCVAEMHRRPILGSEGYERRRGGKQNQAESETVEAMEKKKKKTQIHRSKEDGSNAGQPVGTKQISAWKKATADDSCDLYCQSANISSSFSWAHFMSDGRQDETVAETDCCIESAARLYLHQISQSQR